MTVVLDSGGLSGLAVDRRYIDLLQRKGQWPPEVPSVVLTECLTGDHRRDHAINRVLGLSMVRDVSEPLARRAATLRTTTGRASSSSAVEACVVALAEATGDATILTSDPGDISVLASQSDRPIRMCSL